MVQKLLGPLQLYKLQTDDMKLASVVDSKHSVANIRMFEYIQIFSATISTWLCATLGFERIGRVVILTSRLNST